MDVYEDGVLRERWDDTTRTYTSYDGTGSVAEQRPYTDSENATADAEQARLAREDRVATLTQQLADGIASIQSARDAAQSDIDTATTLKAQADSLSTAITTQHDQVAAWTPSTTYKPADLAAIRDQLATTLTRQRQIVDALSKFYSYRVAVDRNAINTDNALLWLAQRVAESIQP